MPLMCHYPISYCQSLCQLLTNSLITLFDQSDKRHRQVH
uniref:Uncharacterized protein n=1 Tax=Rhizophora mucronata TaxID=61149 RepID=A0A2P2QSG7_RHIMU